MKRGFGRKRAWRSGELGIDAASRRRGHVPEHRDPLFNYIAGTVLPAGYERRNWVLLWCR